MTIKTKKIPLPVMGVDLMSQDTALLKGAVRAAANVDLNRDGSFRSRVGYKRIAEGGDFHSLFYSAQQQRTLLMRGASLYQADFSASTLSSIYPLSTSDPVDYTEYNGNLYFTNRASFGWIAQGADTPRAVGVPCPEAPGLSAVAGGLLPGRYGVVLTFTDPFGEESGASDVQFLSLPQGGGMRLEGLVQRMGWWINVYLTDADGDVLRRAETLPATFSSYVLGAPAKGEVCRTQFLVPLPPGDFVRWHNGRLMTAGNGELRFSNAMRPHLYNPAHNRIPFVGEIAFIESVGGAVYVGDGRGVWALEGADPETFEQKFVSALRAVPRSSVLVPRASLPEKPLSDAEPVAVWLSEGGYVAGNTDGIAPMNAERVKIADGSVGRSAFLLREGRRQIVTPVNAVTTAVQGAAGTTRSK